MKPRVALGGRDRHTRCGKMEAVSINPTVGKMYWARKTAWLPEQAASSNDRLVMGKVALTSRESENKPFLIPPKSPSLALLKSSLWC